MFNVTIKSWWHSGGSWFLEIRAGIQNKVGTGGNTVGDFQEEKNRVQTAKYQKHEQPSSFFTVLSESSDTTTQSRVGRSPAEEWMMNKCAKVGTTRGAIPPVKHKNRLQVGTEGRERD